MNGITHKQAKHHMRADLDGLLGAHQRRDLEMHLHDCEACRAESESLASLTARLQTEFHARWDQQNGPSTNVMANVHSQTRRIMVMNRINVGLRAVAGITALLVLGLAINSIISQVRNISVATNGTQVSGSTTLSSNLPLIAFVSDGIGDEEIYTMRSDGSDLKNISQNPASDKYPIWSPDGTRIAFVSNRDGDDNIYVMNFDGGNVTRLTDDPATDMTPVWSPDGKKIAYSSGSFSDPKNSNIYVVDVDSKNINRVTNFNPNTIVWPSLWSLDGQSIFFEVYRQIVQVGLNGGNIRPITLQTDQDIPLNFVVSKDDSTFSYLTQCNENNGNFCNVLRSIQSDGTNAETLSTLKTPELCNIKQSSTWTGSWIKWSPDRTKILFIFTCEEAGWIYIANADGSDFKPLTNYSILGNGPNDEVATGDWSSDSQSIIFMSWLDKPVSLYTLNVNDALENPAIHPTLITNSTVFVSSPAWQPIVHNDIVEEKPTQTDNRLLAFAKEINGNFDIYTMHADGSGLTNITNDPANDSNPIWSPDGKRIAFESDRTGLRQIFIMNADGSNLAQVTNNQAHHEFSVSDHGPWSPNGSSLLFTEWETSNEKWMLYIIGVDGQNKTPLAEVPNSYTSPSWSPDGQHVAFILTELQENLPESRERNNIYVVNADGRNLTNITTSLPSDEQISWGYSWSSDAQSILFIAERYTYENGNGKSTLYKASLDGNTLTEIDHVGTHMADWWQGTSFIDARGSSQALMWLRPDGTHSTLNAFKNCAGSTSQSGLINYKRSSSGDLIIASGCANDEWWLYWANPDGTVIQQLLNYPLQTQDGSVDFAWSPDAKYVALHVISSDITYMYILDIEEALKDPSIQPFKTMLGGGPLYYRPSWQPVP